MARLVGLKDQFRLAFANDPDSDRHGIVTPSAGLMSPNDFLAVAIRYLLTHRPAWSHVAKVGKTVVSSSMIDKVVSAQGRTLYEVPVGFKWFAPGLFDGSVCFGGEESAGASFIRRDGRVWTTDKDGPIMDLLAAEMTAVTGRDPSEHYAEIAAGGDEGPAIADYAVGRKVIPVSPRLLYAYLFTVAQGLRGMEIERHAHEILEELAALKRGVDKIEDPMGKLGTHLANAQKQFDETRKELTKFSERLREVGDSDVEIASPPPLKAIP